MNRVLNAMAAVLALTVTNNFVFHAFANAETTTNEKVQESAESAGNKVKKGYRATKDKACEMVNGKLECAGKKAMNGVRNAKDATTEKAHEVEHKVD